MNRQRKPDTRKQPETTPFKSKAQKAYKTQRRKNDIYSISFLIDCDNSTMMYDFSVENGLIIQGIFLDLIPTIVLSGFAFQFYKGIEISHPVYSILFSNIVYCIVASFISFFGTIYPSILYFLNQ